MSTDIMTLGGLVFDDWSTPSKMPFGGKQAMAVHKLPGGSRVVDTLGPDEMDIAFSGTLWGDSAYDTALAMNALRISGATVPLTFAGQFYLVVVADVQCGLERYPQYVSYSITCLVVSSPMSGALGAAVSTLATLVGADIASLMSIAGI